MASNPLVRPTMMEPERLVPMGESGLVPESQLSPRSLAWSRGRGVLADVRRNPIPTDEVYKQLLSATGGDYVLANEIVGSAREFGLASSELDRMARAARRPVEGLMAAPYEAAKWVEMNTRFKPLSILADTLDRGNPRIDAQLRGLGLPDTRSIAVAVTGRDNGWPFIVTNQTSVPSIGNVTSALGGSVARIQDEVLRRLGYADQ